MQIDVKDAGNVTRTLEAPNANGRAAAAASRPVALSNEDFAAIDQLEAKIDALGTKLDLLVTAAQDTTTPSPVSVQTPSDVIPFTPVLDTAIYSANDVLFATAQINGITRANDLRSVLMSLTIMDKSKQKPAFSLFFYKTNVTSAAANAVNNLSDADAVNYLGHISVAAADYKDLTNNSFACLRNLNLLLEAAAGTTSVYVVGILDAGTPTFAVGDLVLGLGVVQS